MVMTKKGDFNPCAVINDNPNLLDLLKDFGANLELRDSSNQTALALAMKYNRYSCILSLVSCGARIDYAVDDHLSLVHYAAAKNRVDILIEIREAGNDLSDDYCRGWKSLIPPLEVGIMFKSHLAVSFLFDNCAPFSQHRLERMLAKALADGDIEKADLIAEILSYF